MTEETVDVIFTKADYIQTRSGKPLFKLYDQYGSETVTFNQAVWEEARARLGTPLRVTRDRRPAQNPGFGDSLFLQSIEPLDGAVIAQAPAPMPMPVSQAPVAPPWQGQPTAFPSPSPQLGPPAVEYQRPKHPDEQTAIRKAVALQAAVSALPLLEHKLTEPNQVLAIAEVWERWLQGGQ